MGADGAVALPAWDPRRAAATRARLSPASTPEGRLVDAFGFCWDFGERAASSAAARAPAASTGILVPQSPQKGPSSTSMSHLGHRGGAMDVPHMGQYLLKALWPQLGQWRKRPEGARRSGYMEPRGEFSPPALPSPVVEAAAAAPAPAPAPAPLLPMLLLLLLVLPRLDPLRLSSR